MVIIQVYSNPKYRYVQISDQSVNEKCINSITKFNPKKNKRGKLNKTI